jgi:predicted amidohydrolase YtcJ
MADEEKRGLTRRGLAKGAALAAGGFALHTDPAGAHGHLGSHHGPWRPDDDDDVALVNGDIVTLDRHNSIADWLVVRGDRIVDVGRGRISRSCRRTIDLHGATVIPGLIDSHQHFVRACHNPGHEVRAIEAATSVGQLQSALHDRSRGVPIGEFITCIGGWNRNGLAEKRLPTPGELDAAAPLHPVYLSETGGGNQAVTNSAGKAFFTAAGVTVDPVTGVLSAGPARAALNATQTAASRRQGTVEGIAWVASLGMTMIADQGGIPFADWKDADDLWRSGELDLRLRQYFNGNDALAPDTYQTFVRNNHNQLGDEALRLLGVGERVTGTVADATQFLGAAGWTLTLHSLSATENQQHVDAFKVAAQTYDIAALRWQLHHINDITPALLNDLKTLGVAAGLQSWRYISTGGAPFRTVLDLGIPAGGGSDATNVAAQNPWLNIFHMVSGRNNAGTITNAGQQITRLEALRLYTLGSAYLTFDEGDAGSLEPGKLADLAVLSENYLKIPEDRIKQLGSDLTMLGGNVVHARGRFKNLL